MRLILLLAIAGAVPSLATAQPPSPEFISLEAARPALYGMADALPPELKGSVSSLSSESWLAWVHNADGEVRKRLERGEEDTIANLLRFGVTFTQEYRIDDEYFLRFGESSLVNSFARNRAADLVRALAAPRLNPGLAEMKAFLERKGYPVDTPAERARLKRYLLGNLQRMHGEFLQARQQVKTDRYQMFRERGISLDTNLWPDFDLHQHLLRMAANGMLKPGSLRKIGIIGPGLDFVNKQEGVDFYPPQTIQPFAVLDSLIRLGLADSDRVEIYTLDISPRVNLHIERARQAAARRQPYVVQLPWFAGGRWTDELRARFIDYWQGLGARIGEPVAPIPVPGSVTGIETRAVRIRPEVVSRTQPVDMNIVFQRLPASPEEGFDLLIGTNIFLYYGSFEQSLARSNIAAMLKPGGYLLSNDKLPETVPSGLEQVLVTEIPMTGAPVVMDYIFCYRRGL